MRNPREILRPYIKLYNLVFLRLLKITLNRPFVITGYQLFVLLEVLIIKICLAEFILLHEVVRLI